MKLPVENAARAISESMSCAWCAAMTVDHTFMAPIANRMPVSDTGLVNRPTRVLWASADVWIASALMAERA
ncbi:MULTISPECIES: hypothetical protein [Streptomyces]|uniref:hypothetical protein n=1 Tax=Streptomyces TaxID=1883 RepID=UPI00136ED144|nr:hypothetical protein [Streptomyces sp. SID2888]MYV44889.1 hypothetical protein [Streptomyces sp. SID2888]